MSCYPRPAWAVLKIFFPLHNFTSVFSFSLAEWPRIDWFPPPDQSPNVAKSNWRNESDSTSGGQDEKESVVE
jgi:hypothetical protein